MFLKNLRRWRGCRCWGSSCHRCCRGGCRCRCFSAFSTSTGFALFAFAYTFLLFAFFATTFATTFFATTATDFLHCSSISYTFSAFCRWCGRRTSFFEHLNQTVIYHLKISKFCRMCFRKSQSGERIWSFTIEFGF